MMIVQAVNLQGMREPDRQCLEAVDVELTDHKATEVRRELQAPQPRLDGNLPRRCDAHQNFIVRYGNRLACNR